MAGYRKDAIFVQLLLFHIAVYPIMLIYFNPGISFDIHWHSRIYIYFSSFLFFWASIIIYYLDLRDSSWWTWIGQTTIGGNGMGISTKWFFSFVSCHCDRFMNSTSQPLLNGSCDFCNIFLTSLLNGFTQKTTFDIIWLTYHFYLTTKCGSWV